MQNEGFINDNNDDAYDILLDNIGTSICGMGTNSLPNPERMEKAIDLHDEIRADINELNIQIYRFKFTNDFNTELYKFAKIHQYDQRNVFKEAWEVWLEENDNIVASEVYRLNNMGYKGDIIYKMFNSARYYHRKKSTEKKALIKRRNYIGAQEDFLAVIDDHIKNGLLNEDYKPSDGFDKFCKDNIDSLKKEVQILCNNGLTNSEEIKNKIKKTYKNRYFLVAKKHFKFIK
jgi:hypothetical protein